MHTQRWKAICAYDGTDFCGWQSQRPVLDLAGQVRHLAIQDVLEAQLYKVLGCAVRIHGSGRTDAGVHARGQVFHFDAPWRHGPAKLLRALSTGLPPSILLRSLKVVPSTFHARYSVSRKRYVYYICRGPALPWSVRYTWCIPRTQPVDIPCMQRVAAAWVGKHDFTSFGASYGYEKDLDPVKTLFCFDIVSRGPYLRMVTEGTGYLYKMVRSLVGTLMEVGRGKLSPEACEALWKQKKRTPAVVTAPAQGLFLDRVWYELGSS